MSWHNALYRNGVPRCASCRNDVPPCTAGHYNVIYIGDRVKRGQLNGKSANLNHAIMNHIHRGKARPSDVAGSDILMIMDCDHMVKPDIFLKMGACMEEPEVAVTLVRPSSWYVDDT